MNKILVPLIFLLVIANHSFAQEQEESKQKSINFGISPAFLWGAGGYSVALNGELYIGKRHLLYAGPKTQLSRLSRYSGANKFGVNGGYAFKLLTNDKWGFYLNPDFQWISIPSYRNDEKSHRLEFVFNFMPVYYFTRNIWTGVAFGYGVLWKNVFSEDIDQRKNNLGYAGLIRFNISYRIK